MFSGFLDIAGGKHIHYLFVESQYDFSVDPVIIWFNGGPGCSSLLGFATEHGPFLMKDGKKDFEKDPNPWSWNNNANVLYIESPVGVGYSWIESGYDPKPEIDDKDTAVDALAAINEWLLRFPEYKGRDLYIAGESYGGIYVPYLIFENLLQKEEDRIPVKGMIIANGVTDWKVDTTPASMAMLFWHNLIDLDTEQKLKENNCFPWKLSVYAGTEGTRNEVECDSLEDMIMDDVLPGINPYDIY